MNIEHLRFGKEPGKLVEADFDCLWVSFAIRGVPTPPRSAALQWVDWKLGGQISRFLLEDRATSLVTFIPTMKRLPFPFLALQALPDLDWEGFQSNCEGLLLRRVLYFCEEDAKISEMEKAFSGRCFSRFPECVTLGSDA